MMKTDPKVLEVVSKLKTEVLGKNCLYFEEINSTNTYLKELIYSGKRPENGTLVFAGKQTNGRGRVGRSFFSPEEAGIYMSLLIYEEEAKENGADPLYIKKSEAVRVTPAAAVAVRNAIAELSGADALIKWVNDIYINGKKTCGILTEAVNDVETGKIVAYIIGIGINVGRLSFPDNIKDIATSVCNEVGEEHTPKNEELIAETVNNLEEQLKGLGTSRFLKDYRDRSLVLGKKITVLANPPYEATAKDFDEDGALIVSRDGIIEKINTGEISIKLSND